MDLCHTAWCLHRIESDLERPWIWLEWHFSIQAFSTDALHPVVHFREVLLIALRAMYDPRGKFATYEYRDERKLL